MLSNVTKKIYSAKEISPSPFVSNSMKNSDGAQCNSPGWRSPLSLPSLTIFDSDGGKTGTTALIKSVGNMYASPSGLWTDAKYSKIFSGGLRVLILFS
uniref:Uncharacterized protein n=1 Tax=Arundo donax TaxID=35708 RepID=A0A0A9CHI4_ARUDO